MNFISVELIAIPLKNCGGAEGAIFGEKKEEVNPTSVV